MMSLPHARRLLSAAGAGSALGVALLAPAVAHASFTQNFACNSGTTQTSIAPLGAISAAVTLKGAAGQTPIGGGPGGNGETLRFTMPVNTQQQFKLEVGCQDGGGGGGAGAPGFGADGGSGGGASYLAPAGGALAQALGVAGGGGGGGGGGDTAGALSGDGLGGAGADAGVNGTAGDNLVAPSGTQFGGAGGQSLSGLGGGPGPGSASGGPGTDGQTGSGGSGGSGAVGGGGGGGGGAGGWVGGGGGGGGAADPIDSAGAGGGGGGGGTDHLDPSVTAVGSPSSDVTGDGSVSVTYTAIGQVIGQVPTAGAFNVVATGQTASETVTFSQLGTGQDDPATLGQASITQTGSPFSIAADTCSNTSLAVTATCSITVSASSPTPAPLQGTLTLPNNGLTGAAAVPLFADVVPPATALVRPKASESFGAVTVGQTQDKTFSVIDTGGLALTIGQASVTGSPDFALLPDQDFCSRWVVTASSCTLQVAYTPSAAGAATATLNIPSSDPATPVSTIALSGAGTAASAPTAPARTTPAPPALLSHSASSLVLGKRHAHITFGFTLSRASTVVVTVQRRVKGRWKKVGVTRVERAAGGRSFVLGRRFAGHRLTAGRYRVVLQTRADGVLSSPVGQVITVKRATR